MKYSLTEPTKKENTIIFAATEVFAIKGFHKTTVEEVAQKAGIGKGTIYLYFKNKEDLFGRMISYHYCQLGKEVEKVLQTQDPTLDKLKKIMRINLRVFISLGWIFEDKNVEITHKLKKKQVESRKHEEAYYRTLAQLLIQGEQEGILRKFPDHTMAASTLVACLHAIGVNYSRRKPAIPVNEYTERISDLIIYGMVNS